MKPTWVACFDTDEFLVMKRNTTLIDFLTKNCRSGAIAVNWILFGQPNMIKSTIPDGMKDHVKRLDKFSILSITKGKPPREINCEDI